MEPTPRDTDDFLESSVLLDETQYNEGYRDGYADGLALGKEEGREVGLKLGFQVERSWASTVAALIYGNQWP